VGIPLVAATDGFARKLIDTRIALLPGRVYRDRRDDNDF
jgi:hypothetical protein